MHRWWGKMCLLGAVLTVAACETAAPAAYLQPSSTTQNPTAVLQQGVDALVAAGAPAAVVEVTDGDRRWSAAAGYAVRGAPRRAAPGDPVRIASVTTSMIAAVIMQMVNEQKLTLDTSVDDLVPGTLTTPVTVRELLNHTSGLPDYTSALTPPDVGGIVEDAATMRTDSELVQTALGVPWTQVPGSAYSYSDTDYIVLGEIIEAIDGISVADSLQQRIFGPLGMTASYYPLYSAMPDNALSGYLLAGGVYTDVTEYTPTYWSSAGAVVSTVGEVNRFFRALFDGKLIPPALVAQMQQPPETGAGLGLLAKSDVCESGIGNLVFGQRGDGFGYTTISYAGRDGRRQVTLSWTGSSPVLTADPLDVPAEAAVNAALGLTCPPPVAP